MNKSQKYDIRNNGPWVEALKGVEAIQEMPEMVEVDENFNND